MVFVGFGRFWEQEETYVCQHIETLFSRFEIFRGGLDRRQIREVEFEEFQTAAGVADGGFDLVDGGFAFVGRATGDIDGAILAIEDLGELFTDACVAACHDKDAAGLVGKSFLCQFGFGDCG